MRARCRAFVLAMFAAAGTTSSFAQTYTWVGPSGYEASGKWSTRSNWVGGIVPVASPMATIDLTAVEFFVGTVNDLGDGFDVGTLMLGRSAVQGGGLRVHAAVGATGDTFGYFDAGPIEIVGDVTLTSAAVPGAAGSHGNRVAYLPTLSWIGTATFHGGWRVDDLRVGGLTIAADSSLMALARSPRRLDSLSVKGIYDVQGRVELPEGAVVDLSAGVVDLGRNDQTLGVAVGAQASFGGDVRLGGWSIGGSASDGYGIDRIDVEGTLDLSNARIVDHEFGLTISEFGLGTPYLVIATYENRVGRFEVDKVSDGPPFIPSRRLYPIVYTSAENAGPGEIRVMLPEPSSLLILALAPAIALRRR